MGRMVACRVSIERVGRQNTVKAAGKRGSMLQPLVLAVCVAQLFMRAGGPEGACGAHVGCGVQRGGCFFKEGSRLCGILLLSQGQPGQKTG